MISIHLPKRSVHGKHHDLDAYLEELQEDYFEDRDIGISIGWGRKPRKGASNISLGMYYPQKRLILISPFLDSRSVPRYFVKHVIYHEMLHHVTPWEHHETGDTTYVTLHTETFRKAEACYKYHNKALSWEDKHIHKLLRKIK